MSISPGGGKTAVGTCGRCGGPVTVPFVWHGVIPPVGPLRGR